MMSQHAERWSRREFLGGMALAGTAGLVGSAALPATAEPPPETTRLRMDGFPPDACQAPYFVAEDLLRAEGFADLVWVGKDSYPDWRKAVAAGGIDFTMENAGVLATFVEEGYPIVILAGIHVGCFQLFGNGPIRALHDLKGKTIAVTKLGTGRHILLASMLAYVDLDPGRDVTFVVHPAADALRLFAEGKVDAYMALAQDARELRAKTVGRVVLDTAMDRPWSQYFCCMVFGNGEFVRKHPVATKRVLRAILKATDICAREPERVARLMVERGHVKNYDATLQTLREVPYDKWREYDAEDVVRFYALRLHEVGMIKASPKTLIAQGTDWRFLTELKRELKA